MDKQVREIHNDMDEYKDSIWAIIGFMNFFLYDLKRIQTGLIVSIFQGRRLSLGSTPTSEVTPDLGVSYNENGVIGEVKRSFPNETDWWHDDFDQLFKYDDDLFGWTTPSERVSNYDIVLLVHQSRGSRIDRYYSEEIKKDRDFVHPFIIIEFNRSDEGVYNYFFRKRNGDLSEQFINEKLIDGIQVPLEKLETKYSIKLYDAKPPIPYLLLLIWQNLLPTIIDNKIGFVPLRKRKHIKIEVSIDEMVAGIYDAFSFYSITRRDDSREQKIPKREWVAEACENLVKFGDAEWVGDSRDRIKIKYQEYEDVKAHFIEKYIECSVPKEQTELFDQQVDNQTTDLA